MIFKILYTYISISPSAANFRIRQSNTGNYLKVNARNWPTFLVTLENCDLVFQQRHTSDNIMKNVFMWPCGVHRTMLMPSTCRIWKVIRWSYDDGWCERHEFAVLKTSRYQLHTRICNKKVGFYLLNLIWPSQPISRWS